MLQCVKVHGKSEFVSLQAMCDLFALGRIQSDTIFRNDDYVAAEKSKAIQKLIESLCKELRQVAVPLVSLPVRFISLSTPYVLQWGKYLKLYITIGAFKKRKKVTYSEPATIKNIIESCLLFDQKSLIKLMYRMKDLEHTYIYVP